MCGVCVVCVKLLKNQPLVEAIHQLDYQCKLISPVFGRLGHVHKNLIKGLAKKESKKTVLNFVQFQPLASMQIWTRRCFVYP